MTTELETTTEGAEVKTCADCGDELTQEEAQSEPINGQDVVCEDCFGNYRWCSVCNRDYHCESRFCRHLYHATGGSLLGPGSSEISEKNHKEGLFHLFDATEHPEWWRERSYKYEQEPDEFLPLRLPERLIYLLSGHLPERFYTVDHFGPYIQSHMFHQEVEWTLPYIIPESTHGVTGVCFYTFDAGDFMYEMTEIYSDYGESLVDPTGGTYFDIIIGFAWIYGLEWGVNTEDITRTIEWCHEWLSKQTTDAGAPAESTQVCNDC